MSETLFSMEIQDNKIYAYIELSEHLSLEFADSNATIRWKGYNFFTALYDIEIITLKYSEKNKSPFIEIHEKLTQRKFIITQDEYIYSINGQFFEYRKITHDNVLIPIMIATMEGKDFHLDNINNSIAFPSFSRYHYSICITNKDHLQNPEMIGGSIWKIKDLLTDDYINIVFSNKGGMTIPHNISREAANALLDLAKDG